MPAPPPPNRLARFSRASWARSTRPRSSEQARRQGRGGRRRRPVGAQGRAAVRAGAQVLAQGRDLFVRRLAVAEAGDRRPQLGAAATVFAAGDHPAEALAALGQAAVDFGRAVAGDLADLGVGVALGEEGQGAQLLGLEGLQCLAAAGDRFVALGLLGRTVALGRDQRHPVFGVRIRLAAGGPAEDALAFAADGQGLVLDHGLRPADQVARVLRRRFLQQDLEAALQGVVGVVGAERVAPCRAPQGRLVAGIGLDRRATPRGITHRRAIQHALVFPIARTHYSASPARCNFLQQKMPEESHGCRPSLPRLDDISTRDSRKLHESPVTHRWSCCR